MLAERRQGIPAARLAQRRRRGLWGPALSALQGPAPPPLLPARPDCRTA